MKKSIVFFLLIFLLISCSTKLDDKLIADTVKKADWAKIQIITVSLEDYKFVPDKMSFKVGNTYKLVLKNNGKEKHYYTATDFFKSIALRKVQTKDGEVKATYLTAVEVYPGKEMEIYFVPLKAGYFDLICTIEGHPEKGMVGKITIEEDVTKKGSYY